METRRSEPRFDVAHYENHVTIQEHFCRDWDEAGGCYGTNPKHGYSFDEACDEVATWYEVQAQHWRSRTHHSAVAYAITEQNRHDETKTGRSVGNEF